MKPTKETKLSEIISDDYEISGETKILPEINDETGKTFIVCIPIKKKEEKNFEWYAEEYSRSKTDLKFTLPTDYKFWEFEYRIGLLKFICDHNNIHYIFFMDEYRTFTKDQQASYILRKITEICPKDFIESLIK